VILLDANLLLYAYDANSPQHDCAEEWIEETLSEAQMVGLPWLSILAFLRITTGRQVLAQPLLIEEAAEVLAEILALPNVAAIGPGQRHWEVFSDLLVHLRVTANLVNDAHLAALAIEHGATLYSADRDFARFPGLKWKNPLE
jgi:toxin-antitoxin system PIN domain toxin